MDRERWKKEREEKEKYVSFRSFLLSLFFFLKKKERFTPSHLFGYKAENLLGAPAITSATATATAISKNGYSSRRCAPRPLEKGKIGLLQYDSLRRRGVKFHCRFARWSPFDLP